MMKKKHKITDILDLALDKGIDLQLNPSIKDSEYIVKMCENSGNAYLHYKKKNILKDKEKEQAEVLLKIKRNYKAKIEERKANRKQQKIKEMLHQTKSNSKSSFEREIVAGEIDMKQGEQHTHDLMQLSVNYNNKHKKLNTIDEKKH